MSPKKLSRNQMVDKVPTVMWKMINITGTTAKSCFLLINFGCSHS
jgi:hypothetical protein